MDAVRVLELCLICAIPMGILCYVLLRFGNKKVDYGQYEPTIFNANKIKVTKIKETV